MPVDYAMRSELSDREDALSITEAEQQQQLK